MPDFNACYGEYLRDESRQTGWAESISFPKTEEQVREAICEVSSQNGTITVQGARTGLSASAVPNGGHILNLSRMNKILGARYDENSGDFFLTVQPGVLLSQIRKALAQKSFITGEWDQPSKDALDHIKPGEWFFSPDPTETSASVGGMAACNASGARTFSYGPTRKYIEKIRLLLNDGDALNLQRGQQLANGQDFRLVTENGREIEGKLPDIFALPIKSTAGYFIRPDMDMIDLFIGAEGTLGVITQLEIRLLRSPQFVCGVTTFMPDEEKALDLVRALRGEKVLKDKPPFIYRPTAIEFFNHNALMLLKEAQKTLPAFAQIQPLGGFDHTAVYTEFSGGTEEELWTVLQSLGQLISDLGGDPEHTWVANNPRDMEKLHFFRHSCPECVNLQIDVRRKKDSRITKLGTDMAVPDTHLKEVMALYNRDIQKSGLEAVIFGHIGNNHLHVNIIPRDMDDYDLGKRLYKEWAREIVQMGGTVSAEHGVGKLKVPFLQQMYDTAQFAQMRALKKLFDPNGLFNRNNIFAYEDSGL